MFLDQPAAEALHWSGGPMLFFDNGATNIKEFSSFEVRYWCNVVHFRYMLPGYLTVIVDNRNRTNIILYIFSEEAGVILKDFNQCEMSMKPKSVPCLTGNI